MIATVLIVISVLIFPLFLSINLIYSKDENKLFFCIYLFGILRIASGYAELLKDCIAVHVSEKKAFLIFYGKLLNLNKSIKPLKDYHFIKFTSLIEIGGENLLIPKAASFIYNYVWGFITWFFYNKKPYLKLKNDVNIYENKDILNIFIDTKIVLNLLMIFLSMIKIITEKIINGISKRKQNKFGS